MYSLISFFGQIISKIYSIVDVRIFNDFPLTYIQVIITCIIISFIFKFIFGGFKFNFDFANNFASKSVKVSSQIANTERKKQINSNNDSF